MEHVVGVVLRGKPPACVQGHVEEGVAGSQ